jgi:choline dehydrogenase-like flavoprotein
MGMNDYDAIVVGTGMTGGWAMRTLCEAGLKTLALDRGKMVEHVKDYKNEHKHMRPWEMTWRGGQVHPDLVEANPVQSRHWLFNEYCRDWLINDADSPYVEELPYDWIQPDVVGGKSLMWSRQSWRWGPQDFLANLEDGHGEDWPIRYEDLAPWYDHVEKTIGVSGSLEGLSHLPDGVFQKPMEMNAAEKLLRNATAETYSDRRVIIARVAVLTEQLGDRAACHYCGPCDRGCSTGSYYCTQSVALPAARKTGNLTLLPRKQVESVRHKDGRATGVRVIDIQTGEVEEYTARVVFMCASAPATVRVLLNSRSDEFPDGIANSSGVLGHYMLNHNSRCGARGFLENIDDRYYKGHRPCPIYVPRFRNLDEKSRHPDFVRGYSLSGRGRREGWQRGSRMAGYGEAFKESLRDPGRWEVSLSGMGEVLPYRDNYMTLDDELTDKWGMPAVSFHIQRHDNEMKMRQDMIASAAEMLEAAGATHIETNDRIHVNLGNNNHEMGGARMGRDPKTSVLNGWNQAHDIPNLFVTDGACMASSANQNPSLTYMALTARAANYAIDQLKKGSL